jgi:hypothetical protein
MYPASQAFDFVCSILTRLIDSTNQLEVARF